MEISTDLDLDLLTFSENFQFLTFSENFQFLTFSENFQFLTLVSYYAVSPDLMRYKGEEIEIGAPPFSPLYLIFGEIEIA
jgi:hypothetical protein